MQLDLISSHDVSLPIIRDVTVMRETGLIVVSGETVFTKDLLQLSLQEGDFIKKVIKPPCEHSLCLLCVQAAGREYLALSCFYCQTIKLMNLNKRKENISESQLMQYEVITAFSGKMVDSMCHGEGNRIFVQSSKGYVMELDTSTTTFAKLKSIHTGLVKSMCYVPHPHRLIVVSDEHEVRAMSYNDYNGTIVVWKRELKLGCLFYVSSHGVTLATDRSENKVAYLHPGNGSKMQDKSLPEEVPKIGAMCLINGLIIVASRDRISYYSL